MPRVVTLRVFRWLWVAWQENDFGERSNVCRGFTKMQALRRVARAWT